MTKYLVDLPDDDDDDVAEHIGRKFDVQYNEQ